MTIIQSKLNPLQVSIATAESGVLGWLQCYSSSSVCLSVCLVSIYFVYVVFVYASTTGRSSLLPKTRPLSLLPTGDPPPDFTQRSMS